MRPTKEEVDQAIAYILMRSTIATARKPNFAKVYCSQCGQCFGPGDSGFSHCKDHQHLKATGE